LRRGEAKFAVYIHLAPLTIGALERKMPIKGGLIKSGSMILLRAEVVVGFEKTRSSWKKGDVAFNPSQGFLTVFLSDVSGPILNPLGSIEGGLEILEMANRGEEAVLETVKSTRSAAQQISASRASSIPSP